MIECYGKDFGCKGYPVKCYKLCVGHVQLNTIYELSKLPKKYRGLLLLTDPGPDYGAYVELKKFQDDAKANIDSGKGLFLWSKRKGNGKTTWACKILNEYLKTVALRNNMRCRGLFVPVPELLQDMRNAMNEPSDSLNDTLKNIKSCELVVWDDIGTENPSKWVKEQLYILINYRETNGLSQIFTSNLSLDELEDEKFLGERIVSRIKGQCRGGIFEFTGTDRR